MSVTACGSHHEDTWPWNESIITPGKCFCLFIFSHLHYPLLRCSQVASFSLRECTQGQPPSVSASSSSISQTQIHTYTNQSLSGQTWWERKKSRERIWVHDRPDSQIKVKAIAGCEMRETRGDVIASHIPPVPSTLSVCVTFILPVSSKCYLAFRGFCKLFSLQFM